MGNTIKNILTIGDGIAAWCLHEQLLKQDGIKITNISGDDFFTPCTFKTTSTNCLRGTIKGVSPLGDLIVDSYYAFEDFYNQHLPEGVVKTVEYQCWNEGEKWQRRYPEYLKTNEHAFLKTLVKEMPECVENLAYLIEPAKLKTWYRKRHQAIDFKNALVKEVRASKEVLYNDQVELFDEIYFCTSYASALLAKGFNEKYDYILDHSKPVAGSYLQMSLDGVNFTFDHDFSLALDKYHFIYRKSENILQIGSSTDNKSSVQLANEKKLQEIYQFVAEHLQIELPALDSFTRHTGIRHKGYKRLPFWGEISDGIYAISGLYKNAFSFAYLAAQELVKAK